jgi:hypothetical protein
MKNLTSTNRIQKDVILRIYKKGFGYSKLTVIHNEDEYIAARASSELLNNVRDGDKIQVYFWVEDVASYDFSIIVLGRITVDQSIIFLGHTEDIIRKESRRCLTAHVNLPITFFLVDFNDRSKRISTEEVVHHKATLTELGDREAIVKTSEKLPVETFLKGHILLKDKDIELIGMLELVDEGEYTIAFSGMNDKDRNTLLDYVFSTYRE